MPLNSTLPISHNLKLEEPTMVMTLSQATNQPISQMILKATLELVA